MDTLITIPNDKLLQMIDHQIAILDAFKQADQVLMQGVQGITDLITTPGLINLDFADVKAVMSNAGSALMGIGSARGEDRARAAAEMAVSSPLLEASIDGAHGVLLSIAGGSDLGLFEVSAAADLIQNAAHEDANIIFGTVIDDALGDEVRVTVIAAGFEGGQPPRRQPGISRASDLRTSRPAPVGRLRLVRAGAEHGLAVDRPEQPAGDSSVQPGAVVHASPVGSGRGRRRPRRTGLPQVGVRRASTRGPRSPCRRRGMSPISAGGRRRAGGPPGSDRVSSPDDPRTDRLRTVGSSANLDLHGG